jgi:uncharacterized Zn-finger protein
MHSSPQKEYCKYCGTNIKRKDNLIAHEKLHQTKGDIQKNILRNKGSFMILEDITPKENPFFGNGESTFGVFEESTRVIHCLCCPKTFNSHLALQAHLEKMKERKQKKYAKTTACQICSKVFYSKSNCTKHEKAMHSDFTAECPFCHKECR